MKESIKEAEHQEAELEMLISDILRDVGVPMNLLGYYYAKDAIIRVVNNESYLRAVTKELYPDIARKFETTPTRAERAIRHAIEVAWSRGNIETLTMLFGYTVNAFKDKATNSEFIAGIAEFVRIFRKSGKKDWRK